MFMLQTQGVALSYHICPRWGLASALSKKLVTLDILSAPRTGRYIVPREWGLAPLAG